MTRSHLLCASVLALASISLLSVSTVSARVIIAAEPTPKPVPKPVVKPKPKPKPRPEKVVARATRADTASETSRRFVGSWSGTRTGSGEIVGRDGRYPYTVTCPITVVVSDDGRTASVKLGEGEMQWPNGNADGKTVSKFPAKSNPSFAVRETPNGLVGAFKTSESNWSGEREVRFALDPTGNELRLEIDHTGRSRTGTVTDNSKSTAVLRRSGN
jgi:hypothetical protein